MSLWFKSAGTVTDTDHLARGGPPSLKAWFSQCPVPEDRQTGGSNPPLKPGSAPVRFSRWDKLLADCSEELVGEFRRTTTKPATPDAGPGFDRSDLQSTYTVD